MPWVRFAAGVGLLAVLAALVPVGEVAAELRAAALLPLCAVLTVAFGGMLVSTLRLWVLVRAAGADASFSRLLRAYYIGSFFNNFLPTSVGGDVFKVAEMRSQRLPVGRAAAAVVMDRATGAAAIFALSGAVAAGWPGLFERLDLSVVRLPLAALTLGGLALIGAAYAFFPGAAERLLALRAERPGWRLLHRAARAMSGFRRRPRAVVAALGLSVAFYGLLAVNLILTVEAVGGGVGAAEAAAITPLARMPEIVPVSVGALGVREGAVTYCLAQVGLSPARAAAAALLLRLMVWIHSAAGGCLYALGRPRGKEAEHGAGR